MKKRLAAGALAAASAAAVFGLPATSATAATKSCDYPVAGAFSITRAPASETVYPGTLVYTRGTLTKPGVSCVGYTLGFYQKPSNIANYRLTASDVTDSTGSAHVPFRPARTTRFLYNLTISPDSSVQSGISEIIVVGRR